MCAFTAAVCQMDSQDDKQKNLDTAGRLIDEAAGRGAELVLLPETVNYIGGNRRMQAEEIPGETSRFFCEKARRHGIWLAAGSIPQVTRNGKPKNTMMLISPEGEIVCTYSKVHMFDVEIAGGTTSKESAVYTPGDRIVTADTPLGTLGLSICYDIRFPEFFRLLALSGAQIICVSACFTEMTTRDHWETLLRARAIENSVYLLAANQIGEKPTMTAGGNSMIIDPWGRVLARAGEEAGCIYAQIDPDYEADVRRQIPSLANRREDLYRLEEV